jgi:hypothetical protein
MYSCHRELRTVLSDMVAKRLPDNKKPRVVGWSANRRVHVQVPARCATVRGVLNGAIRRVSSDPLRQSLHAIWSTAAPVWGRHAEYIDARGVSVAHAMLDAADLVAAGAQGDGSIPFLTGSGNPQGSRCRTRRPGRPAFPGEPEAPPRPRERPTRRIAAIRAATPRSILSARRRSEPIFGLNCGP